MSLPTTKRLGAVSCGLAALFLLAAVGCGDDGLAQPSDRVLDATIPPGKVAPSRESCLATHASDAAVSDEARCLCEQCLQETSACDDDRGCTEIRACMQRSGCRDMNHCYFGRAPCRDEIDAWGIMSLALTLAQTLAECSVTQACSVVQEPECSVVAEFTCDGDEDCGKGAACCAHFNGALYDGSMCAPSCAGLSAGDAGATELWGQLCHPGDKCPGKGQSCQAYDLLPDFLYRCEDTGSPAGAAGSTAPDHVNCGAGVCGDGEKCCVRTPKKAYCAPAETSCECRLPTDSKDAGNVGPDTDGGQDDAGR